MKSFQAFRIFSTSILCLVISLSSLGQTNDSNPYSSLPFKERLFWGGDLGLSFGTITSIRVAPLIGYYISPKFSVGVSPSYEYYSDDRVKPKFESTMYGGSAFGRYFVLPSIFLQSSLEILNLEELPIYNSITNEYFYSGRRVTIPVLLVGGGFSQRTPNGSGFFIGGYYDVIQDINSPYPGNFVLRVGGMISL